MRCVVAVRQTLLAPSPRAHQYLDKSPMLLWRWVDMTNVDLVFENEVRPRNSAPLGSIGGDWASVPSWTGAADRPCPWFAMSSQPPVTPQAGARSNVPLNISETHR